MAGHIFCRERTKVGEKEKHPRYKLIAVSGVDLKIHAEHLRKQELEQIADTVGAKVVYLKAVVSGKKAKKKAK